MFNKKSDEQQWSRFRGALAKDRADVAQGQAGRDVTEATAATPTNGAAVPQTAPPPPGAAPAAVNPATFRPAATEPAPSYATARAARSQATFDAEVESLIGEHTTFEGTLKATGPIRVLGTVQGELISQNAIFVDERAQVSAKITGSQVVVAGRVDGQVFCDGKVEIRSMGRVTGEIQAGALIIQEGAFFDGNSKMTSSRGAAAG